MALAGIDFLHSFFYVGLHLMGSYTILCLKIHCSEETASKISNSEIWVTEVLLSRFVGKSCYGIQRFYVLEFLAAFHLYFISFLPHERALFSIPDQQF